MARVEVTFFTAGNRSLEGGSMPVPRMAAMSTEVVTSGSSSVATTFASPSPEGTGFVRITSDGDVWAVAATTPVAVLPASGDRQPGLRVKAGQPTDLAVANGSRIAVINAG